jgi:DNA-binding transcriptional MerR regulator
VQQTLWSVEELAQKSLLFLNQEGDSSRVRWKPNSRQIRYYTTLGLLDRPFGGRGYGSAYGPKHLLQLLAIKGLQHQGLTLAQIQSALMGLSAEQLLNRLGLSQDWYDQLVQPPAEAPANRRDSNFWSLTPPPPGPAPNMECRRRSHFQLAPGVHLVVDDDRLAHLDTHRQQQLAQEMTSAWKRYEHPTKEGRNRR